MDVYCRNPSCEFHTKPFEGFFLYCPRDGTPILGSIIESDNPRMPASGLAGPELAKPAPPATPPTRARPTAPRKPPSSRPTAAPAPASPRPEPAAIPPEGGAQARQESRSWLDRINPLGGRTPRPPVEPPVETGPPRPAPTPRPSAPTADAPTRPPSSPDRAKETRDDPRGTRLDAIRPARPSGGGYGRFQVDQVMDRGEVPLRMISGPYDKPIYRTGGGPGNDAVRHPLLGLKNTPRGLEISPLDSLNGVFLKLTAPASLGRSSRFRIGDYVIEGESLGVQAPVEPLVRQGERFWAKDLAIPGRLTFLRPDGRPGLAIPVFKAITFGRGEAGDPEVDIPLLDDNVSRKHARITVGPDGLSLEDLGSTNGTFLQIDAPTLVDDGAVLRLGDVRLRITRLG